MTCFMINIYLMLNMRIEKSMLQVCYIEYSPFHSSLPFQHLGQSNFCVNQVTFLFYFRAETVSQVPGVLKSIQHLFLGNAVTSSNKTL